jgi:hypothetical protein
LNRARKVLQVLAQLEDWIGDTEEQPGGATIEQQIEISDRLHLQSILQQAARDHMVALRMYLDICRVVHKRADRHMHEAIKINARLGIPPQVTRRLLDQETSRDN